MRIEEVRAQARLQEGVASRAQLLAHGASKSDLDRMVRRRELRRVHPGVYVDHTGPLTWPQRAWAAVLYAGRSALVLDSASRSPDPEQPIHLAIEASRRVTPRPGVRLHRITGLEEKVRWNLGPPRLRPEHNVLELVARAGSELDVVRLLTDAVNERATTVDRLRAAADARPRLRRRQLVGRVLDDIAAGGCSVLEIAYLTRVERAHALPRADRQVRRRTARGSEYRDVDYPAYGLVVELDGRTGHAGWQAGGRDADRDLDDHAAGRESVRLRYHQVLGTPCRTASRLASILARRGWDGRPRRCGPHCRLEPLG